MTVARSQQICVEDTPYYHIVSRCVRRAFLCGEDELTGKSFEHRRQWLIDRIKKVTSVFAINVCSYAIMSNHFHLVLKIGANDNWTDKQVLITWQTLYSIPVMCQRYLRGDDLDSSSIRLIQKYTAEYRERLCSISWFMKAINEYIARMANEEDKCTGHFWESRFKSQALLDERALLTCMAYVDLNPIRAGMAKSLVDSEFTSIKDRTESDGSWLLGFGKGENDLPYYLSSYFELVSESGRCVRDDKRGFIPDDSIKILDQLGLDSDTWLDELKGFKSVGYSAVGTVNQLKEYSRKTQRKWIVGIRLQPTLE